jgi:hypothetical protein
MLRSIWVNDPAGEPAPLPSQRMRRLDAPHGAYFLAFFPKDDLRGSFRLVDWPDYRLLTDSGELREAVSTSLGKVWSCTDGGEGSPRDGEGVFSSPGTLTSFAAGDYVQKQTILFLVPDAVTTARIVRVVGGSERQEVTRFTLPVR